MAPALIRAIAADVTFDQIGVPAPGVKISLKRRGRRKMRVCSFTDFWTKG